MILKLIIGFVVYPLAGSQKNTVYGFIAAILYKKKSI
jgi:hypothetical protein